MNNDITGQSFGKWRVLSSVCMESNPSQLHSVDWSCICECGKQQIISDYELINGDLPACNCKNIHGQSGSSFISWTGMKARCDLPCHPSYKNYGGRGITYCNRWKSYENFKDDMGDRPKGMTLDRIDNEQGYSPENCQWSTRVEQQSNRRNTIRITFKGIEKSLSEWARDLGINYYTVYNRYKSGLKPKDILKII
jgi:hypothetical protein